MFAAKTAIIIQKIILTCGLKKIVSTIPCSIIPIIPIIQEEIIIFCSTVVLEIIILIPFATIINISHINASSAKIPLSAAISRGTQ